MIDDAKKGEIMSVCSRQRRVPYDFGRTDSVDNDLEGGSESEEEGAVAVAGDVPGGRRNIKESTLQGRGRNKGKARTTGKEREIDKTPWTGGAHLPGRTVQSRRSHKHSQGGVVRVSTSMNATSAHSHRERRPIGSGKGVPCSVGLRIGGRGRWCRCWWRGSGSFGSRAKRANRADGASRAGSRLMHDLVRVLHVELRQVGNGA